MKVSITLTGGIDRDQDVKALIWALDNKDELVDVIYETDSHRDAIVWCEQKGHTIVDDGT